MAQKLGMLPNSFYTRFDNGSIDAVRHLANFNWPFFAFWLAYAALMVSVVSLTL